MGDRDIGRLAMARAVPFTATVLGCAGLLFSDKIWEAAVVLTIGLLFGFMTHTPQSRK